MTIQQRAVDDHSNIILSLMARSLNDGATSTHTLSTGPVTRNHIKENTKKMPGDQIAI